jgi:16S rRNA C1402 N4-methylase RsmH
MTLSDRTADAAGGHRPVMLREVLDVLNPRAGGIYVDGTFGGGGYSRALLDAADCTVWGVDRDPDAIAAGAPLAQHYKGRLNLLTGRFGDMAALLNARGVDATDGVALDIGCPRCSSTGPSAASPSAPTACSTCAWRRKARAPLTS